MPDKEHIQAIIAPAGLTLRSVHRPKGGLSGSVFVLETDQGRFILKVSQDPAEDWKPVKERIVYGLLQSRDIPAPNVLAADFSRCLAPFAYTLSECLPGVTLSSAYSDLSDAEKHEIYRHLGGLLGRMHSLTCDRFGDVAVREGEVAAGPALELAEEAKGRQIGPFATWREMHREIVRGRLAFLSRTEFHDLTEPIQAWFDKHDGLLDYSITPRLLHMDLHRSNILVAGGKITGVIDVEEAVIGHNEYDLMRTELAHFGDNDQAFKGAFFEGYNAHVTPDAGYERRRPFYEMSRMLVGLRCLVVFRSSDPEEAHRTRTRIYELLAL
jgi:Ser/Thr protein kinase RdoA (MazF antagonist)